jgi:hypothetical protein
VAVVPADLTVRVEGVKETIRALGRLDPELRKAFNKDARAIVQPILSDAKAGYNRLPLSGWSRVWAPREGKPITPTSAARMRSGVSFSVNTGNKKRSVFKVVQRNRMAAIMERAGKETPGNPLDRSLRNAGWGAPMRIMWPAADKNGEEVRDQLLALVEEVGKTLTKTLGTR